MKKTVYTTSWDYTKNKRITRKYDVHLEDVIFPLKRGGFWDAVPYVLGAALLILMKIY